MTTLTQNELTEKLTKLQRERYSSIYHRYGDESLLIVSTRKTRGRNSFPNVIQNSNMVNNASETQKDYYEALTNEFDKEKPVEYGNLIQRICAQRAKFHYPQFTSNILEQCLDEMAKVYFFEQGTYQNEQNIVIGINPLVRLMVK